MRLIAGVALSLGTLLLSAPPSLSNHLGAPHPCAVAGVECPGPEFSIEIDLNSLLNSTIRPLEKPTKPVTRRTTTSRPTKPRPSALPQWQDLPHDKANTLIIPGPNADMSDFLIEDQYLALLSRERLEDTGVDINSVTFKAVAKLLKLPRAAVLKIYRIGTPTLLLGISAQNAEQLLANPLVRRISQDRWAFLLGNTSEFRHSWPIEDIGTSGFFQRLKFRLGSKTDKVRVYVVDSGLQRSHPQLKGKVARWVGLTSPLGGTREAECNAHGTSIASLITGQNTGLANNVELIDVTIVPCDGTAFFPASNIGDALDWIEEDQKSAAVIDNPMPTIVNMSLAAVAEWYTSRDPKSAKNGVLEVRLREFVARTDIPVIVAAGNSGEDACKFFPALMPEVITVGAYDQNGYETEFTNFGNCVDVFAPGKDVTVAASATKGSRLRTMDGTSPATAIISSVIAQGFGTKKRFGDIRASLLLEDKKFVHADQLSILLEDPEVGSGTESPAKSRPLALVRQSPDFNCVMRTARGGQLNLRAGPGSNAKSLGKIDSGALLILREIDGGWGRIELVDGREGWAAMDYRGRVYLYNLAENAPCSVKEG